MHHTGPEAAGIPRHRDHVVSSIFSGQFTAIFQPKPPGGDGRLRLEQAAGE
jgi:hypothetical protein